MFKLLMFYRSHLATATKKRIPTETKAFAGDKQIEMALLYGREEIFHMLIPV